MGRLTASIQYNAVPYKYRTTKKYGNNDGGGLFPMCEGRSAFFAYCVPLLLSESLLFLLAMWPLEYPATEGEADTEAWFPLLPWQFLSSLVRLGEVCKKAEKCTVYKYSNTDLFLIELRVYGIMLDYILLAAKR